LQNREAMKWDGSSEVMSLPERLFPGTGEAIRCWFEALKTRANPNVIFTHQRDDAHQDHRQLCRLTWNTLRDHCILEYEIPKWDGDMGQPNLYASISEARSGLIGMSRLFEIAMEDWRRRIVRGGFAKLCGLQQLTVSRF
jgi:LmbE family N-acetylglucosaminyl deacetylase